jgi:hypothetical protein
MLKWDGGKLVQKSGDQCTESRLISKTMQLATSSIAAAAATTLRVRTWRNDPRIIITTNSPCPRIKPISTFQLLKLKIQLLWHSFNFHPHISASLQAPKPEPRQPLLPGSPHEPTQDTTKGNRSPLLTTKLIT